MNKRIHNLSMCKNKCKENIMQQLRLFLYKLNKTIKLLEKGTYKSILITLKSEVQWNIQRYVQTPPSTLSFSYHSPSTFAVMLGVPPSPNTCRIFFFSCKYD